MVRAAAQTPRLRGRRSGFRKDRGGVGVLVLELAVETAGAGINDLGQVIGWAHTASEATHVFLYSNGKMTDLGTLGLDPVGEAINNHGAIVGQSGNGAWVWSAGTFQSLNSLIPPGSGFTLNDATAVNDNGQIVANGYNATGQTHAFLLTPTG